MNLKKLFTIASIFTAGAFMFAQAADAPSSEQTDFQEVQIMDSAVNSTETVTVDEFAKEAEKQLSDVTKIFTDLKEILLSPSTIIKVVGAVIGLFIVFGIYKGLLAVFKKTVAKKMKESNAALVTRLFKYLFFVAIVMIVLNMFGISLTAIWGAAGIAGVAIGFAAQTSVSNLISGLFVITEKTLKHGDFIEVDGVSGTVDTIGLLAIKIHTLDNQLIRIPNSTIINTKLMNYSSNKYRRYVFDLSVDYGTDLDKAIKVLKKVPEMCETVITDKKDYMPDAFCTTLGDSGINMCLVVWCERTQFIKTKADVCLNTVKALNKAGINIPFNRLDVTMLTEDTIPAISKAALPEAKEEKPAKPAKKAPAAKKTTASKKSV